MARAAIEADLTLTHGSFRYSIESDDNRVAIRATARSMAALRRQCAGASPLRPLLNAMPFLAKRFEIRLQWRWGPFGLTLMGPDGPTRLARYFGLRQKPPPL